MSSQTIFMTKGMTSQSVDLALVQNAASTAAGDPALGLAYNTSNLVAYYRAVTALGALTQITLATLSGPTAAYSSGGFVQNSSTNDPGGYRFDIPNACLATAGLWKIVFSGAPAATAGNMETHTLFIHVMAVDLFASGSIYAQAQQTQMTESYAATTVVPTPEQAMNMVLSALLAFTQSGATLTMLKRNNSTTAMVGTFNSSSNATGVTQTT